MMSAEEHSAIASDPELAALRLKVIDGIFTLHGKRRTPIRCAAEDLRYVLLWLRLIPTCSFVPVVATTFPYFCYECAHTTAGTCADLELPAFGDLLALSVMLGVILAAWAALRARSRWHAYANHVHNMRVRSLLKEWKDQAELKIAQLEATRRRTEMDRPR